MLSALFQTPEEIERFKQYVNEDHFAMEHTGRVTMLYVKQAYQLGSCELELMRAMRAYAVTVLGLAESAVQVHLLHPRYSQQAASQPPYGQNQAYGQRVYGQNQAYGQAGKWNTNATVWNTGPKRGVVIAFAAVVVSIAVVAVTALICMKRTPHMVVAEQNEKPWEVSDNIESLDPEADDDAKGVTEFEVNYPQITYADGGDASAVNQILRDCACLWMDAMYPEPEPDKVSLSAYDEDYPYLASCVDYEITYMSNDLLCVAGYLRITVRRNWQITGRRVNFGSYMPESRILQEVYIDGNEKVSIYLS